MMEPHLITRRLRRLIVLVQVLLAVLLAKSGGADLAAAVSSGFNGVEIETSETPGQLSGVPFKDWIYGLTFEVPPHETTMGGEEISSLRVDGGTCRNLVIENVQAMDLRSDPSSPSIAYGLNGLSIHCDILARERSLTISFDFLQGEAVIEVALHPVRPEGATYPLPLGGLRVSKCDIRGQLAKLHFKGESLVGPALEPWRQIVEQLVNVELPEVACRQLEPFVQVKAKAAFEQIANQLAPLLLDAPFKPPPEPLPAVPLVDWGTYPVMQVSQALVAARPGPIAKLIAAVPSFDVPFQKIPVNRSVTIEANGSIVNIFLETLHIGGIGTFVPASLHLLGKKHLMDVSVAFRHAKVVSSLQVQVAAIGKRVMGQRAPEQTFPLLEHFDVALDLNDVAAEVETLLMVSQPVLDSLKVDQLQREPCLVSCARDTAVHPGTPVSLRRFVSLNVTPKINLEAPGSLEAGLAQALDTTFGVLVRGYLPTLQAMVRASVPLFNDTMSAAVKQFLANTPPCPSSRVYFGPGEMVNQALFWGGIAIAIVGLGLGSVARAAEWTSEALPSTLATHPCVPVSLSISYPFFVVSTMVLFVLSDLGLGTVVNVVFNAGDQTTVIGPIFSFSVLTIFRDSWLGGAYCIAFLVAGLSGLWPFIKLILLLYTWLAPSERLRLSTRGRLLTFLDQYGKYSLIDSWLAVLALASYDLNWIGRGTSVLVDPVPMLPFFLFVIATVMSLILGHVSTEFHKRSLEWEDGSFDGFIDLSRPRSLCSAAQGNPGVWIIVLLVTGLSIVVGSNVISFHMQTSGAIADLLVEPEDMTIQYSLLSLGAFVTRGDPNAPLGLKAVQCIFFLFAFIIPVLLIIVLIYLLVVPLDRRSQKAVLKLCQVLDAWAAYDVFALGVLVANFEFGHLARFLVYNDNMARICNWIKDDLKVECLHIQCRVTLGFAILAGSAVASYAVPKRCFRYCQAAMAEVDIEAEDSADGVSQGHDELSEEEDGLLKS